MNAFPFSKLFGAPTKLDFVLPKLCSNCGSSEVAELREVHLYLSRYGLRLTEYPGFVTNVPFCNLCLLKKVRPPIVIDGVRRNFIGKVKRIFLRCQNHEFAQAFKALNDGLIASGWVTVIDGGVDV
jgi:hypothetical protein